MPSPAARLGEPGRDGAGDPMEESPDDSTSEWRAPGWQGHAVVLALVLGAVAVALLVQPAPPGGLLSVSGVALPGFCAFNNVTGVPCPGCGLTRSWVAAMRGDLESSLSHHLLGVVILAYALLQGLRHALWLGVPRFRAAVDGAGAILDRGLILLGVALLAVWVPVLISAL